MWSSSVSVSTTLEHVDKIISIYIQTLYFAHIFRYRLKIFCTPCLFWPLSYITSLKWCVGLEDLHIIPQHAVHLLFIIFIHSMQAWHVPWKSHFVPLAVSCAPELSSSLFLGFPYYRERCQSITKKHCNTSAKWSIYPVCNFLNRTNRVGGQYFVSPLWSVPRFLLSLCTHSDTSAKGWLPIPS